jgi:hypothetical protein
MLEDMAVRKFGEKTRHDYIRHVATFAKYLGLARVRYLRKLPRVLSPEAVGRRRAGRLVPSGT